MKIGLWLVALFTAFLSVRSQGARKENAGAVRTACSSSDLTEIGKIAEQWELRYNSGDAAGVGSLYASDAYYLTQHFASGIIHGRTAIQAYVQRGVDAHYHIDSISVLQTTCSGDLGYVIDQYNSTNAGQKAFGVNLVVLKKMGGRWLIVAHEAAVPEPGAIDRLAP